MCPQQTGPEMDAVPNDPARNPADRLNRRYLLAFAGVAALIVLYQLSVQPALIRAAGDAPVINLAGRQRMLSQKVAKEALAIASANSATEFTQRRQILRETVAGWERAHLGLQNGDALLSLPGRNSAQIAHQFNNLQSIFESMLQACRRIDELPVVLNDDTSRSLREHIEILLNNEPLFLERMESIVGQYEVEARAHMHSLRVTGWLIMSAILGVMGIVWFVVLSPAKRLIQTQFRTISKSHDKLEQRIAERTRELVLANNSLEREMSEREQAEERTRRLSQQLAQSTRLTTIGEMAAGLAHEINQPLGAITNFAEGSLAILERQTASPPGLRTALERISAASLRAGAILKRIRTFVRREERQDVPVDISRLIEDVIGLCRFDADAEDVILSLELADDLPAVSGDPVQLQQVLINLIRNSFQAVQTASTEFPRKVSIRAFADSDDQLTVSVIDNGEGIAMEQMHKIFDAFHTTRADGLGLGLAISRSIIEQHGGQLWAEAPPDGGAVFHLTLPCGVLHAC